MAKLRALWHDITDSLWFLPTVLTVSAAALALLLIRVDTRMPELGTRADLWWLFGGGAEGARGVLGAIAGSVVTVTGVVFSVTIVALQLASSQYTPRLLRQFMADRAVQLVLGVFIATFTYTLLVQRTVQSGNDGADGFVPSIAVTVAVALALISVGFLIFFIDHVARSIQAAVIIERVAQETLQNLRSAYPENEQPVADFAPPATTPRVIVAEHSGYLQAVADDRLGRVAEKHGVLLRMERMPGEFILEGQPVASLWGDRSEAGEVAAEVRAALHVGLMRTPHQDLTLGIVELVDVGLKALSPSINDPTTAINVVDRLGQVLLALAHCPQHDRLVRGAGGVPRVLMPRPRLENMLELAVDQLRHFGSGIPAVTARLIGMLGKTGALCPAYAKPLFRTHIERTRDSALRRIVDPPDREHIETATTHALQLLDERQAQSPAEPNASESAR